MANFGQYPPIIQSQYHVCCITMNRADRLRLLACPSEVVPLIRASILQTWGNIQNERPYAGSHEFKLTGYPWHGIGEDAVASRRLLVAVLTVMARIGWNLLQSVDVSKREEDKDSLFFERIAGQAVDVDAQLFSVSFNMGDRIRIIDAPALFPHIREAVLSFWPNGVQNEREYYGSMEMKLSGYPWYPLGEESVHSKLVLARVIANLRNVGYKLYASVDISTGDHAGRNNEGRDLESWVFRRVGPNWQ